jgi:hypothetical protein
MACGYGAPRTELLPVLEIGTPAVPAQELPDLVDSWAWAHAQLGWEKGATEDALRNVLATRPELSVSRLLSPRLLEENTAYIACVVPAFEAGRLAGLGDAPDVNAALAPAWTSGPNAPGSVKLPVYYHWEFRTWHAGGFRIDRGPPRAARFRRHCGSACDGLERARLRRAADYSAERRSRRSCSRVRCSP